jgi:hypothetical protein
MTPVATRCALALLALALSGCTLDKPAWLEQKQANAAEASFYAEQEWEGRLYVFGTTKIWNTFQATREMPYGITFIGAGPQGQTVKLEADARELALQNRVRREYEQRHGALPD